jgi:ribosomal protein L7/L12
MVPSPGLMSFQLPAAVNFSVQPLALACLIRQSPRVPVTSAGLAGQKVAAKREKFVKLAESRTRNAIKAIRVIAKLGNKNAYDYSEADVQKIARALNREVDALKIRMLSTGGKEPVEFSL